VAAETSDDRVSAFSSKTARSQVWIREAPERSDVDLAGGRPRTVFRRALEYVNLLVAEATAREIGHVSLVEALELTLLIARKDPRRHRRVAARWSAFGWKEQSRAIP
jgi:hypothetical protein